MNRRLNPVVLFLLFNIALGSSAAFGQETSGTAAEGFDVWTYLPAAVLFAVITFVIIFQRKSRADKELRITSKEHLEKTAITVSAADGGKNTGAGDRGIPDQNKATASNQKARRANAYTRRYADEIKRQTFQTGDFSVLPVSLFMEFYPAASFTPLEASNDPALLDAIEQTQQEEGNDPEVRNLSLRILAAFRTSNSVDTLAKIAVEDESSNLRSSAVAVLTEFDHESVFEPLLLASADESRDVRAAAARGLFRLSFDRADAWTRLCEFDDPSRRRKAAQAAIEAGLASRSFDRLVHKDEKIAYEAVALVMLLVRSGEVAPIFESIWKHPDTNVKLALLHSLKIANDPSLETNLAALIASDSLPAVVAEKARDIVRGFVKMKA